MYNYVFVRKIEYVMDNLLFARCIKVYFTYTLCIKLIYWHIAETHGIHYISLERNVLLPGRGPEHTHVENKNAAEKESSGTTVNQYLVKDAQENSYDIQKTENGADNLNKDPFELLPDELLDQIIDYSLPGLSKRYVIKTYSSLHNVCSRFRRVVLPYR